MNEAEKFSKRYLEFWKTYHPGQAISEDLLKTAKRYYDLLASERISYLKFDEICTALEKDFKELSYSFNLVAYVLDWVRDEREQAAQEQILNDSRPIDLPKKGKPINLEDRPRLKEALKTIQQKNPELYKTLERLNAKIRFRLPYKYCWACGDSGFISFSIFVDYETGKKTEKIEEIKDHADYTIARRCRCSKGERISQNIPQATIAEVMESARMRGGIYQDEYAASAN